MTTQEQAWGGPTPQYPEQQQHSSNSPMGQGGFQGQGFQGQGQGQGQGHMGTGVGGVGGVGVGVQTKPLSERAVLWHQITQPGAYVEIATGELYRIPPDALQQQGQPVIRKESTRQSRLLQISNNPFLTSAEARQLAAQHDDLRLNF